MILRANFVIALSTLILAGKSFHFMLDLSPTIHNGFAHYFADFAKTVRSLAENLSEEEFWRNPLPFGNSFGHLVLHITGNLNYYIGAELANTGYVRDRAREFGEREFPNKATTLERLDAAVALVTAALASQTDADWARKYQSVGVDDVHDRFSIFLRCAIHFHHHIGQMMYIVDAHQQR